MGSKKSIWFLNHYAVPPSSGSGTRHYDIAEELAKKGYCIKIFASSFDHKVRKETLKKGQLVKKEVINNVEFVWLKTFPYKNNTLARVVNILTYVLMLLFVGIFEKRPDTLVASSFHPLTFIGGRILSVFKRCNFIIEIRDLWPQTAIDMGVLRENSIIVKILRMAEKNIYKKAKKIVILLPGIISYLRSLNVDMKKVVYIPNGVSIRTYIPQNNKANLDEIIKNHKDKFKIIYLGAHGYANALNYIIDVAKKIEEYNLDIDFIFVGDGPEKQQLVSDVVKKNIQNVYFYKSISKSEVPYLLRKMDLGIISMHNLPIYKYGISLNKIFDYLNAELPVLFAGTVYNDIIKQAKAGLSVEAENVAEMTKGVLKMYNMNPVKRRNLGLNGRKYILRNHNISHLSSLYKEIL